MKYEEIRELIAEENPGALLADGLEAGLIGVTANYHGPTRAVYDVDLCVAALIKVHGITEEEAEEYLEFNTLTLGAYIGEDGPVFVRILRETEVGNVHRGVIGLPPLREHAVESNQ